MADVQPTIHGQSQPHQRKASPARRWIIGGLALMTILIVTPPIILMLPLSAGQKAHRALDLARLADLPKGASGVKADGTSNMFSMTYLLRFQAPAAEIEAFIRQSPGLQGLAVEQPTPEHMSVQHSQGGMSLGGHHRFHIDSRYPWFDPTVRNRGRRYEIPQDADARWGEVIIDDETSTVFVQGHRS
jgi:hypothetical protein